MKIQREIKFRAWDKKDGEMLEVHELYFVENSNKFGKGILDEHNDFHSIDEIDLMQFTDLLDKNGKEIYEGDVIQYNDPNDAQWSYQSVASYSNDVWWKNKPVEIIGNIYENPGLLKL